MDCVAPIGQLLPYYPYMHYRYPHRSNIFMPVRSFGGGGLPKRAGTRQPDIVRECYS